MRKTAFVLLLILLSGPVTARAVVYNVNHSFTNIFANTATLTGTLDIPIGNFVIQNAGASPFTNVNLSLTVNATSYNLVSVDTSTIHGTGQFLINATPTTLTFSTANANGSNAADLAFLDVGGINGDARYVIGSDADPRFEVAETSAGKVLATPTFPLLFGTTVPEPSTLLLLGMGAISFLGYRKAKSHS